MVPSFTTILQGAAIFILTLVAGSIFAIWRGYDPATYSATTFLEVHQGAVRGLNVLLPVMAATALVITALLAFLSRGRPSVCIVYGVALLAIAAGGAITRFGNQPINAEIMSWSPGAMPENWTEVRDLWWRWHMLRLATTLAAALTLIAAVFADRNTAES